MFKKVKRRHYFGIEKTKATRVFIIAIVMIGLTACASFKLKRNLSPQHAEFLSKVRYIITSQEKKIFLNLPQEERNEFIQEFWKKRDPNPETENNEYKEQYFERIEEANHLFSKRKDDGWLRDMGRIYILLGPPTNRVQYPTGPTFYGRPTEIWYYGPYPIIFTDEYYSGEYQFYPGSAQYLANLLDAQLGLKPEVTDQSVVFDFKINVEKYPDNRMKLLISVLFESIFLKEEDNKLTTTLTADVQVYSNKKQIKTTQKKGHITVNQDEFLELMGQKYIMTIDMELKPGKYQLVITVQNSADEQKVQKTIKFTLPKR